VANSDKIYIFLSILFSSLIILGNLTYQKFVIIGLKPVGYFELSAGAVLYPLTYFITDLISEFYGKNKAQICVNFSILVNIIIVLILSYLDYLPSAEWSKISAQEFHKIFGLYSVAVLGSLLACYISQFFDIHIYALLKKLTSNKYLWLRSNISTLLSLLIDTFIVVVILTYFKVIEPKNSYQLIQDSYIWKMFFTICCTPIFYISYYLIKYMSRGRV